MKPLLSPRSLLPAILLLVVGKSFATGHQLPDPSPKPILGARSLALSPDGTRLAFCYHGDVWVVPSTGGRAYPLTTHVEMDDNPVWSPDGKYVAFASNRFGSWDSFVTPSEGGETKRLTFASGSEIPTDWSPDGKEILFVTSRDDEHPGIYSVNVNTGQTKRYMLDMFALANPHFTADGSSIIYNRMGFPWTRPRYQGSGAAQVWRYDIAAQKRELIAKDGYQHLWPTVGFDGKTVLAVTVGEKTPSASPMNKSIGKWTDSVARTPNVYALSAKGKTRLTDFVGFAGTRFLTVSRAGQVMAYEDAGKIYVQPSGGKPHAIEIRVPGDDKTTLISHEVAVTGADQGTLSPKGDLVAFVVHNDIWTVPVTKGKGANKDDATQLTDWAGVDSDPIWMPDGKTLAFLSDRDDTIRVFTLNIDTKEVKPISHALDGDAFDLQLTPDKKSLCYWQSGHSGGLFSVPVSGGVPKLVVDQSKPQQRALLNDQYSWSPDGRYVAYVQKITGSGFFYWGDTTNIVLLDTQTSKLTNLTQLSAQHSEPEFSPDGKYLFFTSDRDGEGLYALPLKNEDAREVDLEPTYAKPEGAVKTVVDLEDIGERSHLLLPGTGISNLKVDPNTGDLYFLQAGDVKKASFNGQNQTALTSGGTVSSFEPAADWSQLLVVQGGNLGLVSLRPGRGARFAPAAPAQAAAPATPPTRPRRFRPGLGAPAPTAPETVAVAPLTPITFRCAYVQDLTKEHEAAYNQFWRTYNHSFYDPNFHGRDWLAIKQHYVPFLPSVAHRNEMATLLNEVVGELESSHSEVSPAAGNPTGEPTAHLGFLIDYNFAGPGLRILSVPAHSPGSYAKTALKAGEYVTAINGKPVALNEELWENLNGQVGRDVTLAVAASPSAASGRKVTYRLLNGGEWSALRRRNLIDARRAYVEEKSGGKLTYVQIPGMSQPALLRFQQEAWQYSQGKKGLIIDVRNNGGGNTSDNIIDLLRRYPHAYYRERDGDPFAAPGQMLNIPLVVMQAESSYSNAEMFPAAVKAAKLATLVGMPTPGYVIWTGGLPLVDGTVARLPGAGSYRLDGSPLEDNGQVPDYMVDITPEEFFAGKDPQLDKSIEVLLAKTK